MPDYTFTINGSQQRVTDVPEWLPMLWVLRDRLGITGPKYGCGVGACRACTSHLDGAEFQPCVTPAAECADRDITTIEGLADGDQLHPVQRAWLEMDVAQCGFCQPGQIMTAAALIADKGSAVSDDDIDAIENVCRCGTYARIRQAIKRAAGDPDAGDLPTTPGNGNAGGGNGNAGNGNNAGGGNGNGNAGNGNNAGGSGRGQNDTSDNGGTSSDRDPDDTDDTDDRSSGGLLGGLLGR